MPGRLLLFCTSFCVFPLYALGFRLYSVNTGVHGAVPAEYFSTVLGSAILLTQKHSAACFTHKHWLTLYPCEMQKLFVRLNALGQEFAIFEQCIGCNRRGRILCLHLTGDMNSFQRYPVLSCGFFHPRHPVVSKRAPVSYTHLIIKSLCKKLLGLPACWA